MQEHAHNNVYTINLPGENAREGVEAAERGGVLLRLLLGDILRSNRIRSRSRFARTYLCVCVCCVRVCVPVCVFA